MDIIRELENSFYCQPVEKYLNEKQIIAECLQMVKAYAQIEQCVAVMSDLTANKSYICAGAFGKFFNLKPAIAGQSEIDSIWEEEIFQRIHPDDLFERHLLELRFFQFLKKLPSDERLKYSTSCKIRALNMDNHYHYLDHRTLYLRSLPNNSLWLALCLYSYSGDQSPISSIYGKIINNETGAQIPVEQYHSCNLQLTKREQEVLTQIGKGMLSKEVADMLGISINTVNRHRQNIIEKLGVKNSAEAVKVAVALNLI